MELKISLTYKVGRYKVKSVNHKKGKINYYDLFNKVKKKRPL